MKTYQVRYQGKTVTAQFDSELNCYMIDGVEVHRDAVEYLTAWIATAQVWEWYGDEDHVGDTAHGRYKAKGGEDFLIHLTTSEVYSDVESIIAKLNAKFNREGSFYRYEFKNDLEPYFEPTLVKFEELND